MKTVLRTHLPKDSRNNFSRLPVLLTPVFMLAMILGSIEANAVTKTSTGTGNWNTAGTWSPNGVPAAGDDVVIAAGHTVTIDLSTTVLSVTVNGILTFNSSTNRTLTVTGNVTVNSTGTFTVANASGSNSHTLALQGNLLVNGTLSLDANVVNSDFCNANFNGNNALQTVSGTGTKSFNTITVNKGTAQSNIVDVQSAMSMTNGGLTITNGTFKLSTASTITAYTTGATIPATGGLWNNGGTINTTGGTITCSGLLRNTTGTMNIGSASGNSINAGNAASSIYIENGTLTVAGRINCTNGTYQQSGGTVTVSNVGNTSSTIASFEMDSPATLTISNGTIIVKNVSSGYDYWSYPATSTITGGTVQLGNASSTGSLYYTGGYFPSLELYTAKSAATLGDVLITGNLTLNTSTNLYCYDPFAEGAYVGVTGNVVNNGFIDGVTGTTYYSDFDFVGTAPQTYSGTGSLGSSTTPFAGYGVSITNPTTVTLNAAVSQLYTYRVNLLRGTFINSNKFTLGKGGTSAATVQRGGVAAVTAGVFDMYPTFNVGSGGLYVLFGNANAFTTGYEIPSSRSVYYMSNNNTNTVTLGGGDLDVTNSVVLSSGTFDIVANTLGVGGTLTRTSGNINGSAGTVDMKGTAAQTIPANTFVNNSLKNLVISNTNAATGVSLLGALDIYRSVTFGPSGLILTTGGFLTFKSTATETAWLGNMTGKTITGDATVERYIPNHTKAWQLLSTPTSGQTIKQSWQEGSGAANSNPVSGFGTQITGDVVNATTHPSPGFDVQTTVASMKTFDSTTKTWVGVTSTANPIANPRGYMIFVRGDRSVTTSGGSATATVLRTKGTLYTPANPPAVTNMAANTIQSVGNPYASAIDLTQLYATGITGGVQDIYYVWDPKLTTGPYSVYGYGAYQTFTRNGAVYDVTPGGGSYPTDQATNIESGQAFFVRAPLTAGTVTFTEASKATGSNNVYRMPVQAAKQLRTKLNVIINNAAVLIDGTLIQFDATHSNLIDMEDAVKFANAAENIGIKTNGTILSVERRGLIGRKDTIFYNMGQLKIQQYELEFIPQRLSEPGLEAFLVDKYLNTYTSVSLEDTTRIRFSVVNAPGSYAAGRFMIVFRQGKHTGMPQPTSTVDAKINIDGSVKIDWMVQHESGLEKYQVERSADGNSFAALLNELPVANDGNNTEYSRIDINPLGNDNYYRIRMIGTDGSVTFSNIVKLAAEKIAPVDDQIPSMNISPNPVVNKTMRIRFIKQPAGEFSIQLINNLGQLVYGTNLRLNNGETYKNIRLGNTVVSGTYQVNIVSASGEKTTQQIFVQ